MATETETMTKLYTRPLPPQRDLEEYLRTQTTNGPKKTSNIEYLLGCGEHLWADDAELEAFLKAIDEAVIPGE